MLLEECVLAFLIQNIIILIIAVTRSVGAIARFWFGPQLIMNALIRGCYTCLTNNYEIDILYILRRICYYIILNIIMKTVVFNFNELLIFVIFLFFQWLSIINNGFNFR